MIEKKELIEKVNSMAEFNKWCGIKVLSATEGAVEIQIEWRKEMGQYSGFLHAGLIGTLIDTACGFAASRSLLSALRYLQSPAELPLSLLPASELSDESLGLSARLALEKISA